MGPPAGPPVRSKGLYLMSRNGQRYLPEDRVELDNRAVFG
jgi:hypothetical protein